MEDGEGGTKTALDRVCEDLKSNVMPKIAEVHREQAQNGDGDVLDNTPSLPFMSIMNENGSFKLREMFDNAFSVMQGVAKPLTAILSSCMATTHGGRRIDRLKTYLSKVDNNENQATNPIKPIKTKTRGSKGGVDMTYEDVQKLVQKDEDKKNRLVAFIIAALALNRNRSRKTSGSLVLVLSLLLAVAGTMSTYGHDIMSGFGIAVSRATTNQIVQASARAYEATFSKTVQDLIVASVLIGSCYCCVFHVDNYVTQVGKSRKHLKASDKGGYNTGVIYTLQSLLSAVRNSRYLKKPADRDSIVFPRFLACGKDMITKFWTDHHSFFTPTSPEGCTCTSRILLPCFSKTWLPDSITLPHCVFKSHLADYWPFPSVEAKSSSYAHYKTYVIERLAALTTFLGVNLMKDGHIVVCHDIGK
mmetsp:Transcript_33860/g.39797  ORF Transcript_33860/g.39797 Transcript_33860/m.39797 type:complete len:417 (-) Transcript_33860:56-1306(-)